MLKNKLAWQKQKIEEILKKSLDGQIIKEGIKTIIIGRPNVGKSSLLNKLLEEDKAIVTEIAGTTRDIVEGQITLDGILLNIIDTAGIRETDDIVESIGVKKSLALIDEADLILFVLNNNDILNDDDYKILDQIKNKKSIIVINKTDLENKLDINKLKNKNIVMLSALKNIGFDKLKQMIKKLFNLDMIKQKDYTYLSSARSISILKKVLICFDNIDEGLKNNMPIDMLEIDLKEAWNLLGEIIGENYSDELIDELFSQFCLGK